MIRYVSFFPPGSETVNVACPFCLTMGGRGISTDFPLLKNNAHH